MFGFLCRSSGHLLCSHLTSECSNPHQHRFRKRPISLAVRTAVSPVNTGYTSPNSRDSHLRLSSWALRYSRKCVCKLVSWYGTPNVSFYPFRSNPRRKTLDCKIRQARLLGPRVESKYFGSASEGKGRYFLLGRALLAPRAENNFAP